MKLIQIAFLIFLICAIPGCRRNNGAAERLEIERIVSLIKQNDNTLLAPENVLLHVRINNASNDDYDFIQELTSFLEITPTSLGENAFFEIVIVDQKKYYLTVLRYYEKDLMEKIQVFVKYKKRNAKWGNRTWAGTYSGGFY